MQLLADGEPKAAFDESWTRVLDDQLPHLVGSVAGALIADDPTIVGDALDWAEVVLRHRNAPSATGQALRRALRDALHDLPVATRLVTPGRICARSPALSECPCVDTVGVHAGARAPTATASASAPTVPQRWIMAGFRHE